MTGIVWDGDGKWYVQLGYDFPCDGHDDDYDLIDSVPNLSEALELLAGAIIKHFENEHIKAQVKAREADAELSKLRFALTMAQAQTEELGGVPDARLPDRAPRALFQSVKRFRMACVRRGLELGNYTPVWAALTHYFGREIKGWPDLTASQWMDAAQAVKAKRLGW